MDDTQTRFFAGFHDYTIDDNVDSLENFRRLSGLRNWGVGSTLWRSNWLHCFNRTYSDAQYPFRGEASPYFDQFDNFFTNPRASMRQQFAHLAMLMGWRVGSRQWKDQWTEYLRMEFAHNYGTSASNLSGWQKLCEEVGEVPGNSMTQCKKTLKRLYINIVNLLECRHNFNKDHGEHRPVPAAGLPGLIKFSDYRSFSNYTKAGKIFPKSRAKADGLLKAFLREIFHHH
ncbi:uncharacterized protein J3D65DRAFT_557942 [Phyllosticta citribraziliensis]|uniref:Uncharacterized protein n=1 Tax=Phyllosticta citribraziliensis TaxID=989973 RepID=A0ABR1LCS1_9PEZI